jgi:hypothetical protein
MFRKIHCRSFAIKNTHIDLFQSRFNINSIEHMNISSRNTMNSCENFFPNVTSLTFDHYFNAPYHSFTTDLIRIIPLIKVHTLDISCHGICLTQMLEILRLTPNVHTLTYRWIPPSYADCRLIQQSELFINVRNSNKIKTLNLNGTKYGLETATCHLSLYPYLQKLKILIDRKDVNTFVQNLLLTKSHMNLFHLCVAGLPKICLSELKRLFKQEKFLNNYLIQYANRNIFILW